MPRWSESVSNAERTPIGWLNRPKSGYVAAEINLISTDNACLQPSGFGPPLYEGDEPNLELLISATSGIVLLGTPHRGSSSAGLAHIVAGIAAAFDRAHRSPILNTLSNESQLLEDTVRNFTMQAHRLRLKIHCFYEERETDIAQLARPLLGKLLPTITKTTLVEKDSACLQGYDGTALTLDHFHLNKFSDPADANYILVRRVLEGMTLAASDRRQVDCVRRSWVSSNPVQRPAVIPFKAFTIKGIPTERMVYYRIQGFGALCTLHQASDTIRALFSVEEQHSFELCSNLVPTSEDGNASQTVLMRTDHPPAFLECLEDDLSANSCIETSRGRLCFDRHFKGFTQLYANPQDETITADIIVIPDLNEHAYSSWRPEGCANGIWIQDFFHKDLPRCRLLTYGYIPNFAMEGIQSVSKCCDELLERLYCVRQTPEETHRPLVLIGHGFGCLLAAELLLKAANCPEPGTMIGSLADSITRMIFFAVPRRADIVDAIQDMLEDESVCPSLHIVEMVNRVLNTLSDKLCDFAAYFEDREALQFEPLSLKQTLQETLTSWSRLNELFDLEQPLITTPVILERKVPGNRSTVSRLGTVSSPTYKSILGFLQPYEKKLASLRNLEWFEAARVHPTGVTNPFGHSG
ncbi:hypothetical protein LX32DRAFT_673379 [Colletotrichum zoysiae]|uniref:Uncharacterized protein n=1 Tax=Colletotrichum zoysiae TaxID=1216348 RepID=A0AAD9HHX5_9PEZI|nr:hypothetical protein LX32DRAFT_673379 [Colletotrichum zoysiae]